MRAIGMTLPAANEEIGYPELAQWLRRFGMGKGGLFWASDAFEDGNDTGHMTETQTLEQLQSGQLAGCRELRLNGGLTQFPRAIFDLADTLELLDLSGNQLSALPADLPRLHRMRVLFASDNVFTELPAVLGQCPALSMIGFKANRIRHVPVGALPRGLRWLILTDNEVEFLPSEIGQCQSLQKLMLAGNRLQALPAELAQCQRLELLRISANPLTALPDWLVQLPRLSWLAFAGTPYAQAQEAQALESAPIERLPWSQLQLGPVLGQGASGVIYSAQHLTPGQDPNKLLAVPVAVKIFKGEVTSDGLPASEMAASIQAGSHPYLIPAVAKITDHPTNAQGLVMPLIDPAFVNLAGPPSLASCTRDVYPDTTSFDLVTIRRMALAIASAAAHLHAQGLMHGDLYAHNILHNGLGQALLGDLGAASFLPTGNPAQAQALQRLEVRAYGCLLQEWTDRCKVAPHEQAALDALIQLQGQCLHKDPQARPLFADIERTL